MRHLPFLVLLTSACGERVVEPYEDPASCDIERAVDDAAADADSHFLQRDPTHGRRTSERARPRRIAFSS